MDLDLTLLPLMVLLILLVLGLRPLLWSPLLRVLDQRQALTHGSATKTASLLAAAAHADSAYARQLQAARQGARTTRDDLLESGRASARTLVETARRRLGQELAAARQILTTDEAATRASLTSAVDGLARQLVGRLLQPPGRP